MTLRGTLAYGSLRRRLVFEGKEARASKSRKQRTTATTKPAAKASKKEGGGAGFRFGPALDGRTGAVVRNCVPGRRSQPRKRRRLSVFDRD
jgi:hypothetical protein